MAGTKVKVKVTQGKSTVSPPRDYFFISTNNVVCGGPDIRMGLTWCVCVGKCVGLCLGILPNPFITANIYSC